MERRLRLDDRKDITKTDWFMWTGALDDSDEQVYSAAVVDKVFSMLEADRSGIPVNDCYNTTTVSDLVSFSHVLTHM